MSEDAKPQPLIFPIPVCDIGMIRARAGSVEIDVFQPVAGQSHPVTFRLMIPAEQAALLMRAFQHIDAETGMLSAAPAKPPTVQ